MDRMVDLTPLEKGIELIEMVQPLVRTQVPIGQVSQL